ncbi:hydrogenase maturation protease [Kitasatospora cinereorecta]|uniref:Hydrogenase maturation protease n=1 Tax=Kitasatospora cinereorecta TaxID=285560 RepID=A0ABW0V5W8_9ACTN
MGATAERASPPDRIVVIGVGNPLRGDDGVGTAVVDVLAADPCPVARLAVCDGEPARLIELWDGAELAVVLDAVRVPPERAGRLHRLRLTGNGASVPGVVTVEPTAAGSHGLGLGHALALATVLGRVPRRLVLLAIGGSAFGLGHGLGPAVAEAVPGAAAAVRGIVARHRAGRR